MISHACKAATDSTSNAPQRLITDTGFNPDGTVAVSQKPPSIRLVGEAEARSTLLSQSAAISHTRSFEEFAKSANLGPESRETLCTLGMAIDVVFRMNPKMMPLITGQAEDARKGDLIEFICKLNTVVDISSPLFGAVVEQASQDISDYSKRIFATRADSLQAKAMVALIDNAKELTKSVAATRMSNDRGQEWFNETAEYGLRILVAIRDFRTAEQQ